MSDEFTRGYYELERITEILLGYSCSTAIGAYLNSVVCGLVYIKPSSLSIPIYYSINDQTYEKVIEKLNSITNDEVSKMKVKLSLEGFTYGNYQTIKIAKKEGNVRPNPL